MNILIIIFQILCFSIYIGSIIKINKGVPDSISESFRILQNKYGVGSLKPYVFWLFLASISFPLFWMTPNWASFICLSGILLVGAACKFWEKNQEKVHIAGAVVGILFGFIAIGILPGWYTWLWIVPQLLFIVATKGKIKNYTYWVEFTAVGLIILAELIHLT